LIARSLRYFNTLKHLKGRQIFYQGFYRLKRVIESRSHQGLALSVPRTGTLLQFVPFIAKVASFDGSTFAFLNLTKSFGSGIDGIDWAFDKYGKLWTYNLNYFDFLLQPGMDRQVGLSLIDGFIARVHKGNEGFESYPVSLRGINWIKFLSLHQVQREDIGGSLYAQYLMLYRNLEYHLLGNHLLENAFSLLFGACYFRDASWFAKSRKLLQDELREQVLDDGAHFELSPMYHQIILDRLLDCINLLKNNQCFDGQEELLGLFREKAVAMVGWLKTVTFVDGSVPHLNDATDGIAPSSLELFAYASRLGVVVDTCLKFSNSGYRKLVRQSYECLVDIGAVGPDYIPGHAHADTLNFVLQVHGKPFLVDIGTSTYEKGDVREEERSTWAHNTVVLNGQNSSDVWGGFRVGKRARVKLLEDSGDVVIAEHDGYKNSGVIHRREWRFEMKRIVVHDRVIGGSVNAEARFHFDYAWRPEVFRNMVRAGDNELSFFGADRIELVGYRQALGFNRTEEAWCVVVRFCDKLDTLIVFQ
jgi:hypothetical protein